MQPLNAKYKINHYYFHFPAKRHYFPTMATQQYLMPKNDINCDYMIPTYSIYSFEVIKTKPVKSCNIVEMLLLPEALSKLSSFSWNTAVRTDDIMSDTGESWDRTISVYSSFFTTAARLTSWVYKT